MYFVPKQSSLDFWRLASLAEQRWAANAISTVRCSCDGYLLTRLRTMSIGLLRFLSNIRSTLFNTRADTVAEVGETYLWFQVGWRRFKLR